MKALLYLFDDRIARRWEPFASTRPAGELLFGALRLRERIERALGLPAEGYLAVPGLEGFEEVGAPPAIDPVLIPTESPRIVLLSRAVLPILLQGEGGFAERIPAEAYKGGCTLRGGKEGDPIGWILPRGVPLPSLPELLDVTGQSFGEGWKARLPLHDEFPEIRVTGAGSELAIHLPAALLWAPWEVPVANADQLRIDLERLYPGGRGVRVDLLPPIPGVDRIGDAPVSAEEGVTIDPGVVLDTRKGPIHLGARVRISPFTWLKGPSQIGPDSILLGGVFDGVSCGPVCRLRGEIEESVILGYSNKAHDGYLGHALLGRWVNLGALTTNSDLKNNYGSIRVGGPDGETDTGLLKMGPLLGDHVKTGIGTLLDAGTVIGAGSNVFGGGFPGRKWIPPFSWGGGKGFRPYDPDSFLSTAEKAMGRRNVELSERERGFLSRLWERVHGGEGATG